MQALRLIGVVVALAAPATVHAGGYYIGDVGARATARGGAFVASPDSLLAIVYNPAGLALLNGAHLEGDLNLVSFDATFKRRCPCVDPTLADAALLDRELEQGFIGKDATNQRKAQDVPFAALGYGLPFLDLTVAFGVWGPQGARRYTFRTDAGHGAQRYSVTNVELKEVYYALGVALSPIEGLRIGATAQLYDFATVQELNLYANSRILQSPEVTDFDIPTKLDFRRNSALNWSLGVSYDLPLGLTVGGSVLGKRSVRAEGTATVELPSAVASFAQVQGDQIEVEVNLPPIWRAGLQWELEGVARAEAAVVVEAWQVNRSAVIRSKDVALVANGVATPLATIAIDYNFDTTVAYKLGGELNLFEPYVGVRGGYFYEPSVISPEFKDVSTPDLDKHAVSVGLATTWFGVTLEVAAQYIVLNTIEVTNSEKKQVAPLEPPLGSQEYVTTIGNGTYSGSYFIGSASLSVALDPLLGLGDD